MSSSSETRGDPAFEGSDAITHEPVVEEERASPLPDPDSLRHPFPWAVGAVVVALAVAAVIAGAAAGWLFAIPILIVDAIVLAFAVTGHRVAERGEAPQK